MAKKSSSQSGVVRIALIGAGRAGMIHARNFRTAVDHCRLAAVADPVESAAEEAARTLEVNTYYTDYRELLQNDGIDAVVIATPTKYHCEIAVAAAAAGKHIFCEKPMAMTVEECDAMIEACERNNVKLQIGFMRRYDASFREAKAMLDAGAIGELVQVHSNTRGPSKPRPWMYDIKKSNGILAEVNSHDIDAVRWMAGSDIESVFALAGNFRNPEAREGYPDYYDSVVMSGKLKNGVHFVIDGAAYVQYGYDAKMELIGTKGKIEVGRSEKEFVRCTSAETGTQTPFVNSWMTLFIDAYLAEDTSFVAAIREGRAPEVTGYDGRMAVATVEAGNASIREGAIKTVR